MGRHHVSSYGSAGGAAAILAAISWLIQYEKNCSADENVKIYAYLVIVVGIILFALSFFNFAGALYEIKILFLVAVAGFIAVSIAMFHGTYLSFYMKCNYTFGGGNVFSNSDGWGIAATALNLLSALLLLSAALTFYKRY